MERCSLLISQEYRDTQRMFRSAGECHDQCSWSHSINPSNAAHDSEQYLILMSSSHRENPQQKPDIVRQDEMFRIAKASACTKVYINWTGISIGLIINSHSSRNTLTN
jgi:hypothetical protein